MKKINVKTYNKISRDIIKEAKKLNLKAEKITESFFNLSKGNKKMMFAGSMPETTSSTAYKLTNDKYFTYKFLRLNKFPVLEMECFSDLEQAKKFLKKYKKIVVKPREGIHGKGITIGIEKEKDLKKAIEYAKKNDPQKKVILEEYFLGKDYRLLVIGKKKVFAINRVPAFVTGDGKSNLNKLINLFNKNSSDYQYPVSKNKLTKDILKKQGFNLKSIPGKKEIIQLRETANVKSGGLTVDMTGKVNKNVIKKVKEICKLLNLDIAGIDWMTPDLKKKNGKFIEINAYPGILLHKYPAKGKSHNIANELLTYFFYPEKFNKK